MKSINIFVGFDSGYYLIGINMFGEWQLDKNSGYICIPVEADDRFEHLFSCCIAG